MLSWWWIATILLTVHVVRIHLSRYQKLRYIEKRYGGRYALSANEAKATGKPRMMDSYRGVRDAQRIVRLTTTWDTPFMFQKALEFALFRTYGIPTISSLLLHTGQLGKSENASRRYVDTSVLIQSFMTYPVPRFDLPGEDQPPSPSDWESFNEDLQDPRSAIALARTNFLHSRWKNKISNNDMLYTLSVFFIEPPKWIDRYEWRNTTELEKEAIFAFFYHLGRCMGIQDIPQTREEFIQWSVNYEKEHMVYTKVNHQVARHTVSLLLHSVPCFLHDFAEKLITSFMDDRLRTAMGYDAPPAWVVLFKDSLLATRAFVVKTLLPPRSRPLSSVPIGSAEDGAVFNVENFLNNGIPGVCPASGALASSGKTCPVGGHMKAEAEKTKTSPWRMELKWYENDPVYSRGFPKWSLGWCVEEIKVGLGLMKTAERRGGAKWRAATLPAEPKGPVEGLGGFRLEECGPKGLETKGRKEVFENATKLYGKPLEGIWTFEA